MGHSANIRALNRLKKQRAAKKAGCPELTLAPRGKTNHVRERLEQRVPLTPCPFSLRVINDMVRGGKASVKRAKGSLNSITFSTEGETFEIRASMHGKRVEKIVTAWRL